MYRDACMLGFNEMFTWSMAGSTGCCRRAGGPAGGCEIYVITI